MRHLSTHPWGNHVCAGTLFQDKYHLATSRHCFVMSNVDQPYYAVFFKDKRDSNPREKLQIGIKITHFYVTSYTPGQKPCSKLNRSNCPTDFAVAVLSAAAPVDFIETCKHCRSSWPPGTMVMAVGWGMDGKEGELAGPKKNIPLRKTWLKIRKYGPEASQVNQSNVTTWNDNIVTTYLQYDGTEVPAGWNKSVKFEGTAGLRDACFGDSGGPLLANTLPGEFCLIATVQGGGYNCKTKRYPEKAAYGVWNVITAIQPTTQLVKCQLQQEWRPFSGFVKPFPCNCDSVYNANIRPDQTETKSKKGC